MIWFSTHARNHKNTSVSKPTWLKVNTPALCMSQIRQFGRRRKHFLFTRERAPGSHSRNLFVCRDCICAQLNLRQNKYMCHNVSEGRGRQSWIEDKKKRIRSVTSCANPGFSRLKLCCTALERRGAFMSIYPPQIHANVFIFIKQWARWRFSILNLHFTSFQPPIKFSPFRTSSHFPNTPAALELTLSVFLKGTSAIFQGLQSFNCLSNPQVYSWFRVNKLI